MDHTNHSSAWIIQTKMQRKQRNKKQTVVDKHEINFKVFAKNCTLSTNSGWNLLVACLAPNFIASLDLLRPEGGDRSVWDSPFCHTCSEEGTKAAFQI